MLVYFNIIIIIFIFSYYYSRIGDRFKVDLSFLMYIVSVVESIHSLNWSVIYLLYFIEYFYFLLFYISSPPGQLYCIYLIALVADSLIKYNQQIY